MKAKVPTFVSVQVAVPPPSSLASTVYIPVTVPPCEGRSVTVPLLFSSRKIEVRLPPPSALKRPAVAIGPVELAPLIRNANPLFSEAAVKDSLVLYRVVFLFDVTLATDFSVLGSRKWTLSWCCVDLLRPPRYL